MHLEIKRQDKLYKIENIDDKNVSFRNELGEEMEVDKERLLNCLFYCLDDFYSKYY